MRVTRLVVIAVLLCVVVQTVSSRRLKFKTFGAAGLGGSTGTACSGKCNNTSSGGGSGSSSGGSSGSSGGPSYNDTTIIDKIANCTTLACKLNATRSATSGGSGSSSNSGSGSGGCTVIQSGSTLSTILSNYNDSDEDKNLTDVALAVSDYQHKVESTAGTQVYLTGASGLMKVQAPDSSNYVSVKFRKLSDSDGQIAGDFENATWTWVGPTTTTRQGIQATVLTANGSVSVTTLNGSTINATFYVEVLSFNESGSFNYGSDVLNVDATSVKISYNITGWPFNNTSGSFLYLAVTVNANSNGLNSTTSGVTVGDARVTAPTMAYVDDVESTVDLFVSADSDDTSGCQAKLLMVFPQFNNSLYYDPIFTPQGTAGTPNTTTTTPTSAPTKAAVGSSFSLITALLAVLLMLALNQF